LFTDQPKVEFVPDQEQKNQTKEQDRSSQYPLFHGSLHKTLPRTQLWPSLPTCDVNWREFMPLSLRFESANLDRAEVCSSEKWLNERGRSPADKD
jgi:hypothetical protein